MEALNDKQRASDDLLYRALLSEARKVFKACRVELPGALYHMPSPRIYNTLFSWDSGFHAVIMSHVELSLAQAELETLFGQVAADGHLPHESLLPGAPKEAWMRRVMADYSRREYDGDGVSHLVDPPVAIIAAERVFEAGRDAEWLSRIWPRMRSCLGYLLERRDDFGDGLVSIRHPWEAGTDLSPQFYEALGIDQRRRSHAIKSLLAAPLLYRYCGKRGWDTDKMSRHRFAFEDLTMNSIVIRACRSMSALAAALGSVKEAVYYDAAARRLMAALEAICWDETDEIYYPRFDLSRPRLARVKTAASLLPLFTGLCDDGRAEALVHRHLLEPSEFATEFVLPFVAHDELAGARPWVERRLWAGHCIWINFNWMVTLGLYEHGFAEPADELARRTCRLVADAGFWEYYDSRSGKGRRTPGFTWPGLALDLAARLRARVPQPEPLG
ncbi:MAG: MGH1-like glycoside hydrolase domain-containing protein [Candidatus Geothermincolia bacterium]